MFASVCISCICLLNKIHLQFCVIIEDLVKLFIIVRMWISEWIILTLCITGCFILTGLSCLILTYRKRQSLTSRITNEPHYETVNLVSLKQPSMTTSTEQADTGYLHPCFAMEDDEIYQLKDQTSQEEYCSTTSSISVVVDQDAIAYETSINHFRRIGKTAHIVMKSLLSFIRVSNVQQGLMKMSHK